MKNNFIKRLLPVFMAATTLITSVPINAQVPEDVNAEYSVEVDSETEVEATEESNLSKKEELENRIAELQDIVDEYTEDVQTLTDQVESITSELAEVEEVINDAEDEVTTLESKKASTEKAIEEAKEELANAIASKEEAEAKLNPLVSERQAKIDKLLKDLDELEEMYRAYEELYGEFNRAIDIDAYREQVNNLKDSKAITDLRNQIASIEESIESLNSKISGLDSELSTIMDALEKAIAKVQEAKDKYDALSNDKKTTESQLKLAEDQLVSAETSLDSAKSEYDELMAKKPVMDQEQKTQEDLINQELEDLLKDLEDEDDPVVDKPAHVWSDGLDHEFSTDINDRGYGGRGYQEVNRTDEVTVTVSIGDTDPNEWSGVSIIRPLVDCNGKAVSNYEVTFGDQDGDTDIDMTDLALYLDNFKVGDAVVEYTTSGYGDFLLNVFGCELDGWLMYTVNDVFCQYGTPDMYNGDNICIGIMMEQDEELYYVESEEPVVEEPVVEEPVVEEPVVEEPVVEEPTTEVEADLPELPVKKEMIQNEHYIQMIEDRINALDSIKIDGNGYWQDLYVLRVAGRLTQEMVDKIDYSSVHYKEDDPKFKIVDLMRVCSVLGTQYDTEGNLDRLARSAIDTTGTYAVDYNLIILDEEKVWFEGEEIASELKNFKASSSKRDDAVYYILNTGACWGGSWWTYDTGCQNAQGLVAYYSLYPEVKEKIDTILPEYYAHFMDTSDPKNYDCSSAAEFMKLCSMLGRNDLAEDIYKAIEDMGIENTKFKGNKMDITRMARAEASENCDVIIYRLVPSTEETSDDTTCGQTPVDKPYWGVNELLVDVNSSVEVVIN